MIDDEARQNALSSKLYQVAKQQKTKQDGHLTPSPPPPTPAIPSNTASNHGHTSSIHGNTSSIHGNTSSIHGNTTEEQKPVSILKSADSKARTQSAKSVTIESPKGDSVSSGIITNIDTKTKDIMSRALAELKEDLPKAPVVPPLKRIAIVPATASSPLNRPREMKKTLSKIHETTGVSNVTSSLYVLPKAKPGKSKGLRHQNVVMTGSSIGVRNG